VLRQFLTGFSPLYLVYTTSFLKKYLYSLPFPDTMTSNQAALIQFIKYALAGGLATLTHIIVFHLVGWKFFPSLQAKDHAVKFFKLSIRTVSDATRARNSMISNGIAFLISNMVAYVTNVLWVFQGGRYHFIIELLLFYIVSGISVFLGTLLMGLLIKRFGLLTTYAFGANIFTAVMINYAVRKFIIFSG
jgi:putative flippase GtrA